ncbi:PilW family protein [Endozoicomonas ascidiicola]|uniref:PilW family protein n=1 Tax=Endozoicomonas ascidiicola TaxID=1698521 RepID=UPI00082ACF92|nr:PilW family protein [Endozoicomonas ascidiicola]
MNKIRWQSGLTMIELIISLAVSLLVIAAVVRFLVNNTSTEQFNYQFGIMQQSARIGLHSIANDTRLAGYTGCSNDFSISNVLDNTNATDEWIVNSEAVQGITRADVQSMVDPAATSEGIVIFKLSSSDIFSVSNHNTGSGSMSFTTAINSVVSNETPVGVIRQDCQQTAIFVPGSVSGNQLSYSTSGGGSRFSNCSVAFRGGFNCYDPGSSSAGDVELNPGTLRVLDSVVYFVKPDAEGNTLYRKRVSDTNAVPVVSGIEQLAVYYGVDTDGSGVANRFIQAGDLAFRHEDWDQVTVIRLHLLTQSAMEITRLPRAYFFNGGRVTPTDSFLRKEFVMTIDVRN